MLVGERMSKPVIVVNPEMPINEAMALMRNNQIRRVPVTKNDKLVGIVTAKDIINAAPSPATSLSIWEMNYLLSQITIQDVMTKDVFTVNTDTPIEVAAKIMVDNKIGGLPVTENNKVVGIITETDLFKIFLELMGAREHGVRVVAIVPEKKGLLASLTQAIANENGNFVSLGQFAGERSSNRELTFKVSGIEKNKLIETIKPFIEKITDIRIC